MPWFVSPGGRGRDGLAGAVPEVKLGGRHAMLVAGDFTVPDGGPEVVDAGRTTASVRQIVDSRIHQPDGPADPLRDQRAVGRGVAVQATAEGAAGLDAVQRDLTLPEAQVSARSCRVSTGI